MLSDMTLLARWKAGDAASFETLFLRHYAQVYKILYRLLGNKADAEDAAQQIFFKLYHTPARIRLDDETGNLAGWLYRVAVNEGYNTLRSRKRRHTWQERLTRLWPFDTHSPDPAHQVEQQAVQETVRDILAALKPRQAKLLILRHSGFSYQEIAAALDIAPGSVGSLLTRAERAFRAKYEQVYSVPEVKHAQPID